MQLNWKESLYTSSLTMVSADLPVGRVYVSPVYTGSDDLVYLIEWHAPNVTQTIRPPSPDMETGKRRAEAWASEQFPLHALAALAKENPDIPNKATGPQDAETIKRIRRFLSLAVHSDRLAFRLGRPPTPREITSANQDQIAVNHADWRQLNELLSPFLKEETAAPPEWSLPPRPKTVRPPPRPPSERELIRVNRGLLRAELKKALGLHWARMDRDAREGYVSEALIGWMETGGTGRISAAEAKDQAKAVRRSVRSRLEKEVPTEGYSKDEAGSFTSPEAAEADNTRAGQSELASQLRKQIEESGPAGKLQVALVELHLGERVFPGQPGRLQGTRPASDLRKYHPGIGRRCPTCQAISRYVRVRGLTEEAVARAVDGYYIELQQVLGA